MSEALQEEGRVLQVVGEHVKQVRAVYEQPLRHTII